MRKVRQLQAWPQSLENPFKCPKVHKNLSFHIVISLASFKKANTKQEIRPVWGLPRKGSISLSILKLPASDTSRRVSETRLGFSEPIQEAGRGQ